MAKKYYVVWVGRKTGVFSTWPEAHKLVDKFPAAKFKSFTSLAEAKTAFASGWNVSKPATKTVSNKSSTKSTSPVSKDYDITIYCDGGCEPNPGQAASGVAVYQKEILDTLWFGLYNPQGTNNSAELNALHQSLLIAEKFIGSGKSVQILCDSQYSINCITNWAFGWKQKGWKRKVEGDIKNLEIIQAAHSLYERISADINVSHVKAHIGIEGNELADRMTIYGITQKCLSFNRYSEPFEISTILALRPG